ncbi:hypothetical protein OAK91_04495 [Planctomycetaceae bacterium]|nr:hypothetical protein [Planctomycetaceae bacterium]
MLKKARKSIQDCEQQLRSIMAEASEAGMYDDVDVIMDWARKLNELAREDSSNEGEDQHSGDLPKSGERRKDKKRSNGRRKKNYPRFLRSRDELLKVGWSKKDKREYLHRAPWSAVELLCLSIMGCKEDDFTSEDVLPLVTDQGDEFPSYQSYLCLAWLRDSELISKEGRQGYHVHQRPGLLNNAKEAWKNLPRKTLSGSNDA